MTKDRTIGMLVIFVFVLLILSPKISADWGNDAFANSARDLIGDDLGSYSYNYGSFWSSSEGNNKWWTGGEYNQFLQRALGSSYDALSSSVCELFVDKTGMPAGVMLGAGGYPVGHIEGSYYEYFVFNETNPYNYPDDVDPVTPAGQAPQSPGEQYEIKRIYKISFEVDPKDIAGSDKLDLIFTVGGKELDLDLTNESIGNIHEIDVDGDAFFMKGETIMIRNATKSGGKWKMQLGVESNGDPIWSDEINDETTEICIRFDKKEDLNPEFSSYLINGDKACNTFKATEFDMGDLVEKGRGNVLGDNSGWYIPTEW